MIDNDYIGDIFLWVLVLLAAFMIPALIRMILGKTLADRVVALDTINTLVVASMIVGGAAFSEPVYIDVAIVYALLSFITTLYIAKYMEITVEDDDFAMSSQDLPPAGDQQIEGGSEA